MENPASGDLRFVFSPFFQLVRFFIRPGTPLWETLAPFFRPNGNPLQIWKPCVFFVRRGSPLRSPWLGFFIREEILPDLETLGCYENAAGGSAESGRCFALA